MDRMREFGVKTKQIILYLTSGTYTERASENQKRFFLLFWFSLLNLFITVFYLFIYLFIYFYFTELQYSQRYFCPDTSPGNLNTPEIWNRHTGPARPTPPTVATTLTIDWTDQ